MIPGILDIVYAFRHLTQHVQRYGFKHKLLFSIAFMVFFFNLADAILTYILPLIITQNGFSKSEMGLIIGSSSLFGIGFDLLLGRYLKKPHYQRLYAAVLILTIIFIAMLYGTLSLVVLLFGMAVWGLYWNLFHFSNYDFVSRAVPKNEHANAFGVISVFHSFASTLGPLIAGLVIGTTFFIDFQPFLLAGVFVFCAALWLWVASFHISMHIQKQERAVIKPHETGWIHEMRIWRAIGRQLFPLLVVLFLMFTTYAFFWTIGPLIAEDGEFGIWGGLLLTAFTFPSLFTGWLVGKVTKKHGKKRTALWSFFLGSLLMTSFPFMPHPALVIGVVGVASFFYGFTLPAIDGALADYIAEAQEYEKEIQSLSDFFYNVGWSVGPITAGFLADGVGNKQSFIVLGVVSVLTCLFLLNVMPKKIVLKLD